MIRADRSKNILAEKNIIAEQEDYNEKSGADKRKNIQSIESRAPR